MIPDWCPHDRRKDYRYMPWCNKRQCRWCGATETDDEETQRIDA